MTIPEYKEKFIELCEQMEREHGTIKSLEIESHEANFYETKTQHYFKTINIVF